MRGSTAYISTDSTRPTDPDLYSIDITDPLYPRNISSINTGPGISSFGIIGDHLFASAMSTAGQLQSIFVSPTHILTLEHIFKLPLPYATATAPYARSIFIQGTTAVVGTEKWDGPELSALNISNATNPVFLGGLEIGSEIHDIYVRDTHAYVASAGQLQVFTVDVHDPAHMTIVDALNPSGWARQQGNILSVFEHTLRAGRTSGGFNITQDPELFFIDEPPTSTQPLVFANARNALDMPGGVYGIVTTRSYTFVATRSTGHELYVFDEHHATSTAFTYALPASPLSMTCDNHSLYVLANGSPLLYKIDFHE